MTPEEIGLARALRIAVISGQVRAGNLTVEQGRELLRGPLTPGDNSTIIDDSEQLVTDENIARAARAEGFRAGAEAMRTALIEGAVRYQLFDDGTGLLERFIRDMPLPEPPQ